MGVDICFYIQKKEKNEWKDVCLFKDNHELATIARCGYGAYDIVREDWHNNISDEDIEELATATGWRTYDEEIDFPYYCISYAKVKYLREATKILPYDTEEEEKENIYRFYKELALEIEMYLRFTDDDWIDEDNIRIIAFVSY